MQEEVKHYKVKSLPTQLRPNSVYYVKATSQSDVKTYITDQTGFPFPLIDLNTLSIGGIVNSLTGTGVTGTSNNPIVNISTFNSSQLGNLIELSSLDGKLFVKPITSPDGSIDIVSTSTSLEMQLGSSLQTQIQNALQSGDNISELTNDAGYITLADIPFSAVSATSWTPNHTTVTGNPYLAGTIVYYLGHIFQANFNNDSIVPAIGGNVYWTDLGVGYLIDQEQTDWLAISGPEFLKNKPTNTSSFINDGDDTINPFISLTDLPYQIEMYDDSGLFPLVGQNEIVYLAEDTGIFYLWDGIDLVYNQITSNAFPTGLERITVGPNTGWRLIGRDPLNYGPIGIGAVDLSSSTSVSIVFGARGTNSFATGQTATASGQGSASVGGNRNRATGDYSFIGGGSQNDASGNNSSTISGYFARARSFCEHVIGSYNTDYTPTSTTGISPTDRSFVIGAGTIGNLKDVLTVYKNGAVKFFVGALSGITNLDKTGFFTFNSTDSNRPYIHNGTDWKALAYTDEVPLVTGFVPYTGATSDVDLGLFDITAAHLIKDGGVNTQFLKADGSVDNNIYLTSADLPSTLELFATTVANPLIPGYTVLVRNITDIRYNTTAVDVPIGPITTQNMLVGSLISDNNIISGNPGLFDITTIGNIRRTSGTGQAEFYFRIYKRDVLGVETFITQSNVTLPVLNGGYAQFSALALWNNGVFLDTDRVVIKYYASRIITAPVGSDPSFEFQFGGITPVRSAAAVPVAVIPNIFLADLADVENVAPLNNETLYWNATANLWEHALLVTDAIVDGVTTIAPSQNVVFEALALKANVLAATSTGVVISFLLDTVYGTLVSPETGNITTDVTGAKLGVTNIIIHNSTSIPTFSSEFKKLSGSGDYEINVVNYIYCSYITSTEIIYSINQRT